jgi:hypothetical protein
VTAEHKPRRPSPELLAHLGAVSLVLTYENTSLHIYAKPYVALGHFQVITSELPHEGRVFDHDEIFNQCYVLKFPLSMCQYPDPEVIEAFVEWQTTKLEAELGP